MERTEKIVRVRITGRVQGVGFRAFTRREAEARGVSGWVRNRANGDVEAVFAGSESAVAALCETCRHGPPQAQVEGFEIAEADASALDASGQRDGFHQLPTR